MGPLGLLSVLSQTLISFLVGMQPLLKGFDSVHILPPAGRTPVLTERSRANGTLAEPAGEHSNTLEGWQLPGGPSVLQTGPLLIRLFLHLFHSRAGPLV